MILEYNNITITLEELKKVDRTNPYKVVGALIQVLGDYNPKKNDSFYEKLQYLFGDFQPISEMMKQQIKDRMLQNDKYSYIGKSYFIGSTPENDYNPPKPYKIEVKEGPYTDSEEGFKRLFVKSGGADHERPITLRLAKDGNFYLWSDSLIGLLTDIRPKESTNIWA